MEPELILVTKNHIMVKSKQIISALQKNLFQFPSILMFKQHEEGVILSTYSLPAPIITQSLNGEGETKEAKMQNEDDNGGGTVADETTHPRAT